MNNHLHYVRKTDSRILNKNFQDDHKPVVDPLVACHSLLSAVGSKLLFDISDNGINMKDSKDLLISTQEHGIPDRPSDHSYHMSS